MRMDKFLKVSRILRRRGVANDACAGGNVYVGDKAVKPSYRLKVGDVVRVRFSAGELRFVVKSLNEKASKEEASQLYEII